MSESTPTSGPTDPLRDDDIETVTPAAGQADGDGSDSDGTDSDGTDGDGTDSDGTDGDATDG